MRLYIDVVPNRNSPPAVLLREAFREAGKVRKRTLANLSSWPPAQVETLRQVLRGQALMPVAGTFETVRSRPHGHVAAVLGTLRRLGLDTLLGSKRSRERDLCSAMIVDRIMEPRSKLATAQGLDPETLHSSLGQVLGLQSAGEDELYAALDWLLARQGRIERELAARHLAEGTLTLYDLTSTYVEGRHCPLAHLGHSRDDKKAHCRRQSRRRHQRRMPGVRPRPRRAPQAWKFAPARTPAPAEVSERVLAE
jgi:hypothetical protein